VLKGKRLAIFAILTAMISAGPASKNAVLHASPVAAQTKEAQASEPVSMDTPKIETQGSGAATAPSVRTPEDMERDRDIAPSGGTPAEVPNRSTIPQDEYLRLKEGSANGTRRTKDGNDPQR
jgi:hypothetical protein